MGPLSPIGIGPSDFSQSKFFQTQLQQQTAIVVSEEDGEWWASIQQCGATIALAAALTLSSAVALLSNTTANQPQDDPSGSLYGQPDEDFWINPVPPVQATLVYPQQQTFDEQIPAGNLYGPPAEDYWINPVAPVPATFLPVYLPDPEQYPFLYGQSDEDFWNNPVVPVLASFLPVYLPDPEQYPFLFGQQDYDFWSPQIPAQLWPQPFQPPQYDELIVSQPITFQPDEDFWINPVPSTLLAFQYFQPWTVEDYPALYGQPDEDFWINQVVPVFQFFAPLYLPDPEQYPFLYGQYDEDFWQNPTTPVSAFFASLYLPDPEQMPVLYGQPDEDFWSPQIPAQLWPQPSQPPQYDEIIVPQSVVFQPDEDFWQNFVAPVWFSYLALYLPDPENVSPTIPFVPGVAFNRVELGWGGDVAGDNVTLGGFG